MVEVDLTASSLSGSLAAARILSMLLALRAQALNRALTPRRIALAIEISHVVLLPARTRSLAVVADHLIVAQTTAATLGTCVLVGLALLLLGKTLASRRRGAIVGATILPALRALIVVVTSVVVVVSASQ